MLSGLMPRGAMPRSAAIRINNNPIKSAGLLRSHVAGRTDRLPIGVAANSHVIPADVVSGLGQGNTMAGAHILDTMFHGMKPLKAGHSTIPRAPKAGLATGGATHHDVPIMAAGGEYVVHPDHVAHVGGGSHKEGHKVLDKMIMNVRKHTIKTLSSLPKPKK